MANSIRELGPWIRCPLHIGIFLPSFAGGGAERAMVNLARGCRDLGHQVDLVVNTSAGPYRAEVPDDIEVIDLCARRSATALGGLVRYLRCRRPNVMYSVMEHANVVALMARAITHAPIQFVVSIRDTLSKGEYSGLNARAVMSLARFLYPKADGIVAVSEGVADDAATLLRLDRRRISVIANPVIMPELRAKATERLDHPWFQLGAPPVVLACGRLTAQKDFPTLLHAFAKLRQQRPARLLILGEGQDRAALETLGRGLGVGADLALPGFDANPWRYMARAAVFALSSVHEGSPNVLVQALACGCPVVSTDCPSGPRETLAGVEWAWLVPMHDPVTLALRLELALARQQRPPPLELPAFHYLTATANYLAVAGLDPGKDSLGRVQLEPKDQIIG